MARHIVLNADVVVVSRLIEDTTSRFRGEVIERRHPDTAVRLIVGIIAVVEARPDVVVAADLRSITVEGTR